MTETQINQNLTQVRNKENKNNKPPKIAKINRKRLF